MNHTLGVHLGSTSISSVLLRPGHPGCGGVSRARVRAAVQMSDDGTLVLGGGTGGEPVTAVLAGRPLRDRWGDPAPGDVGGRPWSAASLVSATLTPVVGAWMKVASAPTEVVVTRPADWGVSRHEQLDRVLRHAGLGWVRTVSEAEALAAHALAGRHAWPGETVVVLHVGGGRLCAAVARITDSGARVVPGSVQTLRVGGLDFDEAVRRHADRALDGALTLTATRRPEAREPIRRACENAKHRLSVAKRTELSITLPAGPRRVRLNRNELETLIRDDVGVVLAQLRRAVRGAGLGQRDLAAVVLTGGSARVPLLGRALREGLRRPVRGCENPDGALAFGAAVAGA